MVTLKLLVTRVKMFSNPTFPSFIFFISASLMTEDLLCSEPAEELVKLLDSEDLLEKGHGMKTREAAKKFFS